MPSRVPTKVHKVEGVWANPAGAALDADELIRDHLGRVRASSSSTTRGDVPVWRSGSKKLRLDVQNCAYMAIRANSPNAIAARRQGQRYRHARRDDDGLRACASILARRTHRRGTTFGRRLIVITDSDGSAKRDGTADRRVGRRNALRCRYS